MKRGNLNDYLKPMQAPAFKPGFEANQMVHLGNNPIHVEHLQKALQSKPAKLKMHSPKMDMGPGSPWLAMMGDKK